MSKILKPTLTMSVLAVLIACGNPIKTVDSNDQLFSIEISSDYKDVMDKKDFVVANRLEGTPVDSITLLQAKNGDIANDLLYAVTLTPPEGIVISLDEFKEVMNDKMKTIDGVIDFRVLPVENSDTELTYIAETNVNNAPYYEYCKISVKKQMTTICIGTEKDQNGAKKAIDSIKFKRN